MKKHFVLITILILSLCLAACGNNETKPNPNNPGEDIVNPNPNPDPEPNNPDVHTEEFTVKFETNNETSIEPQKVNKGGKVIEPAKPFKDGYLFSGWYSDGVKWDFNDSIVTKNIVLKAVWNALPDIFEYEKLEDGTFGIKTIKDKNAISATIPEGITKIASGAFKRCIRLERVIIPSTVTKIEEVPFYDCLSLNHIEVDKNNGVYDSRNDCNAIIETKTNKLLVGCGSTIIPEGVTSIEKFAFKGCLVLECVVIPESVISIGESAFRSCDNLAAISISRKLEVIGERAFDMCGSLLNVYYSGTDTDWNKINIARGNEIFEKICTRHAGLVTSLKVVENDKYKYIVTDTNEMVFVSSKVKTIKTFDFKKEFPDLHCVAIGLNAFLECSDLESVVLDEHTKSIGKTAFARCSMLNNIVLPDGVKNIGEGAFAHCVNLSNITIPRGVVRIGSFAFNDCTALESIVIPEGIDVIEEATFINCTSLNAVAIPSTIRKIERNNFSTSYNIEVFYGDSQNKWEKIIIEDGNSDLLKSEIKYDCKLNFLEVVNNEKYKYYIIDKKILHFVEFKNKSVTSFDFEEVFTGYENVIIEKDAFYNCLSLRCIEIPNGVTTIENYAFSDCTQLKNIIIPNSVKYIGDKAFNYDESTYIFYKGSEEEWNNIELSIDAEILQYLNIIYNFKANKLDYIANEKYEYLHFDTNEIAFIECKDKSITSIDFEKNFPNLKCILIESGAFGNCSNLTDIVIPDGVKTIEASAFSRCKALANLVIPSSVVTIEHNAFSECDNLKSIVIPEGVISIEFEAFSYCRNVSSLAIPSSVKSISNSAFEYMNGGKIPYVYYSGSLEEWNNINIIAAGNNPLLEAKVHFDTRVTDFQMVDNEKFQYLVINNYKMSFIKSKDTKITELDFKKTFPDLECISIEEEAFDNSEITSLVIPSKVKSIEACTFRNCQNLTSVLIPMGVTSICSAAFVNCRKLSSIVIPETVTNIEPYAFSGCSSLESINLPSKITCINEGTFKTSGLKSIVIPNTITSIESSAFYSSFNLTAVIIPKSLTKIDFDAFQGCNNIENVFYAGTQEEWNKIDADRKSNWTIFLANIEYESSVNQLEESINEKYNYLTTNTNKVIFLGCNDKTITSIDFKKEIGDYEFITIGAYAFDGCESLTSVTIPSSTVSIGYHAFYSCKALKTVIIPKSVTQIGNYAFRGNGSLTIYCEATTMPKDWGDLWDGEVGIDVVWGYKI